MPRFHAFDIIRWRRRFTSRRCAELVDATRRMKDMRKSRYVDEIFATRDSTMSAPAVRHTPPIYTSRLCRRRHAVAATVSPRQMLSPRKSDNIAHAPCRVHVLLTLPLNIRFEASSVTASATAMPLSASIRCSALHAMRVSAHLPRRIMFYNSCHAWRHAETAQRRRPLRVSFSISALRSPCREAILLPPEPFMSLTFTRVFLPPQPSTAIGAHSLLDCQPAPQNVAAVC